ncbi:MAG: signal transduction histidine kinase [Paracoccaceae bacterium]|jgi:signal transduction histidine kinase
MLFRSLSGRLLLLTIIFVMLTEVVIFLPSVARFRVDYLSERLERAQIASLALLATPDDMVSEDLENELLATAGVRNIVLRRNAVRELILTSAMPPAVDVTYDLRDPGWAELIVDAIGCAIAPPGRMLRVIGAPTLGGGEEIEVTIPEDPLRHAMMSYGLRVLALSLVISIITASLIVLSVRRFVLGPMARVIDNMRAFCDAPEDASRVMRPASGIREIAAAERALAEMEVELRAALRQRARLAALGEAVAKISHDLRNVVMTAQLLADRLAVSGDPAVRRVGPKLIRSLDRAEALCTATLDFGRAQEPAPEMRVVLLRRAVEEVRDEVFADAPQDGESEDDAPRQLVRFVNAAPDGLTVAADPDHLHRILANLARNARQAIEATGRTGEVTVAATSGGAMVAIEVHDDGPGLPNVARDHLFTAFKGGARSGGSGLGLAIAAELAQGIGGRLTLIASDTSGTRFRLDLRCAATGGAPAAHIKRDRAAP